MVYMKFGLNGFYNIVEAHHYPSTEKKILSFMHKISRKK